MFDLNAIKEEFANCPCGREHKLNIKDIVVESGATLKTGEILKRNGFKKKLLLVADKNTIRAAEGILDALKDFDLTIEMYDDFRSATVEAVEHIKELLTGVDGVISVGTGSLNDVCRKAAADTGKDLCIFATAPSMDGFASYNAPLIKGSFKTTVAAKSPEVVIADTKILATSPVELKRAGFGDMVGKYVGLIDWQVSAMISGEYYCEKVANLTRKATDMIMDIADRVNKDDEESAGMIFTALLLTGIGMSFVENSRPASGTEHILSHFWECSKVAEGKIHDFHGKMVGVATLYIMDIYRKLYKKKTVKAHKEVVDWDEVYNAYGEMADDVKKLNTPDTITDGIDPELIEKKWQDIRNIIASVPDGKTIKKALKTAGCATKAKEVDVDKKLLKKSLKYHPYMRRRLSLRRISNMID